MRMYVYLGDRQTDPLLRGQRCIAVVRADGKCIRGRNGTMRVKFESGRIANIIGRLLRKVEQPHKL